VIVNSKYKLLVVLIISSLLSLLNCSNQKDDAKQERPQTIKDKKVKVPDYIFVDSIRYGLEEYYRNLEKENEKFGLFPPEQGIVPDAKTAIKIAEAVWIGQFGEPELDYRPYRVYLINDSVWIVHGVNPEPMKYLGGARHAKIRKSDGKILLIKPEG
jgi:NTF2 fold immunity protein